MEREVLIRYCSHDHVPWCERCPNMDSSKALWRCKLERGNTCGQVSLCPLHKWKRG